MAEIVILGSGSGFATAERFCTSVALLAEDSLYLFDCGEPVGSRLFAEGIDPLALNTLFISHMHPDHIGGLATLLFAAYLPGRSGARKFKPWSINRNDDWYRGALRFPPRSTESGPVEETRGAIRIVMPGEAIDPIQRYLSAVYLDPAILPFDLEFEALREGPTYDDGLLHVTTAPNRHLKDNFTYQKLLESQPQRQLESYSFRGEIEGMRFVFSGDIESLEELNPLIDADLDLLIVEVAHFDPALIRDFVRGHGIRRTVLTHIHPGLETRVAELVAEWQDPSIEIAHDGLRIALDRAEV